MEDVLKNGGCLLFVNFSFLKDLLTVFDWIYLLFSNLRLYLF